MPVGAGGASTVSGRALGCECRVTVCGVAFPKDFPWWFTAMSVMSNGSNTNSTRRPVSDGSTW